MKKKRTARACLAVMLALSFILSIAGSDVARAEEDEKNDQNISITADNVEDGILDLDAHEGSADPGFHITYSAMYVQSYQAVKEAVIKDSGGNVVAEGQNLSASGMYLDWPKAAGTYTASFTIYGDDYTKEGTASFTYTVKKTKSWDTSSNQENNSGKVYFNDKSNASGNRPGSLTIKAKLHYNYSDPSTADEYPEGTEFTSEASKDNGWTYDFGTGLPYSESDEVTYSYTVEDENGYTVESVDADAAKGSPGGRIMLKNSDSEEEAVMNVSGNFAWENDYGNSGSTRPDSFEMRVLVDGVVYGDPVSVTGAEDYAYSVSYPYYRSGKFLAVSFELKPAGSETWTKDGDSFTVSSGTYRITTEEEDSGEHLEKIEPLLSFTPSSTGKNLTHIIRIKSTNGIRGDEDSWVDVELWADDGAGHREKRGADRLSASGKLRTDKENPVWNPDFYGDEKHVKFTHYNDTDTFLGNPVTYTVKASCTNTDYAVSIGEWKLDESSTSSVKRYVLDLKLVKKGNLTDEPLHEIVFTKKSSYDKSVLGGAEFSLTGTTEDGEAVSLASTSDDATGTTRFTGLYAGTYVLSETKAPDGYVKDSSEHIVTVDHDGEYTISGLSKTDGVYDFYNTKKADKEITVTKVWDDGMDHGPDDLDIVLSTEVPQASVRTYTINFNANGGTFGGS